MRRIFFAVTLSVFAALPLRAEVSAPIQQLANAMAMQEIIDIMHEEGVAYGTELAEDMFPERAGPGWEAMVRRIYDRDWMTDTAMDGFAKALDDTDTASLTAFFTTELGREIIALEVSARRALMDDEIEAYTKETAARMIEEGDPRIELLERYIEVNSLMDSNVVGALNSNFAFYTGLADGGAFPEPLSDEEILNDVWSQEVQIREDTQIWLYSYLNMAYRPLSDEDLQAYIDISDTPAGQALNEALFAGFDKMFESISHSLGLAAAQVMSGEDL